MPDWYYLIAEEKKLGLYDRNCHHLRIRWINALRSIVAKNCPKNKMGSPLVSDIDLLTASLEERFEALEKIKL